MQFDVRGLEKMFRKMKAELERHRSLNDELETTDLDFLVDTTLYNFTRMYQR